MLDLWRCNEYPLSCRLRGGTELESNKFFLSLVSGKWHRQLTAGQTVLELDDLDAEDFRTLLDVCCSMQDEPTYTHLTLEQTIYLGSSAHRHGVLYVLDAVEKACLAQLRLSDCFELLPWSRRLGLRRLHNAALHMLARNFEKATCTPAFRRLPPEELADLVQLDELVVRNEEAVWEAVRHALLHCQASDATPDVNGERLVKAIRFPHMSEKYLNKIAAEHGKSNVSGKPGLLERLVREALEAQRQQGTFELQELQPKVMEARVGLGVKWAEYDNPKDRKPKQRRLQRSTVPDDDRHRLPSRIVQLNQYILVTTNQEDSAGFDGIEVFRRNDGMFYKTLLPLAGDDDASSVESDHSEMVSFDQVTALAVYEGRLVSGHDSGSVRVWAAGENEMISLGADGYRHVFSAVPAGTCGSGHGAAITVLCACGDSTPLLAAAIAQGVVTVWANQLDNMTLLHTLQLDEMSKITAMIAWEKCLACGSEDGAIQVWDVETGNHVETLTDGSPGQSGKSTRVQFTAGPGVAAMVKQESRLYSASENSRIVMWDTKTNKALKRVVARPSAPDVHQDIRLTSLVISGSNLVAGFGSRWEGISLFVYGLEKLELLNLVPISGRWVGGMLALDGEVWATVDSNLVVWGRGGESGRMARE